MKNYTISQKRYEEILELDDHFFRIEEQLHTAMEQTAETKKLIKLCYTWANEARSVLYDKPLADTNETALQKLVRTSGLSAEELNRIVGGE